MEALGMDAETPVPTRAAEDVARKFRRVVLGMKFVSTG
tara:strand:- start:53279 stop:53392 length:114 start_codon:yes stop_codon:yes gene_type:complete